MLRRSYRRRSVLDVRFAFHMLGALRALVVAFGLLVCTVARPMPTALAQQVARAVDLRRKVSVAPRPKWVEVEELPSRDDAVEQGDAAARDGTYGVIERLYDQQVNVPEGRQPVEHYVRRVRRVVTHAGVDAAGQVNIDFNPAFQEVRVHSVVITRDGQARDALRSVLDGGHLRVVSKESSLDAQIYDGSATAFIVIPDLRDGDELSIEYSVLGANSIFAGRFSRGYVLGTGRGAKLATLRVRAAEQRPLQMRVVAGKDVVEESSSTQAGVKVRRFVSRDLQIPPAESEVPPWVDRLPVVDVTEFADWAEVARWAAPLFETTHDVRSSMPSALTERIATIARAHADPAERALAATRFVQHEIRYLGIELGENSHRPHPPAQVLAQRFGDCKDKALLLVTLLRGLGVEASVALVNTDLGRHLADRLPAPTIFDHVVVKLKVGDQELWVDATRADEVGPLAASNLRFGLALEAKATARDLIAIPEDPSGQSNQFRRTTYTVEGADARIRVELSLKREAATAMRTMLRDKPRDALLLDRLNAAAAVFRSVERVGEFVVRDDIKSNHLEIEETFLARGHVVDGVLPVRVWALDDYLLDVPPKGRVLPVELLYPLRVQEAIVVEGADFEPLAEAHIEDDNFVFTRTQDGVGKATTLHFTYQTKRDAVPATEVEASMRTTADIRDELFLRMAIVSPGPREPTFTEAVSQAPRWVWVSCGMLAIAVLAAALRRRIMRLWERLQTLRHGATLSHDATRVADRGAAVTMLVRARCTCGRTLEATQVSFQAVRLGGETIESGRVTCGACGASRQRYFRITQRGAEPS
jgi:hypothetical protein